MLFIIPGIWIFLLLVFSIYAYLLDNKTGMSALAMSWYLARGKWFIIAGRFIACLAAIFAVIFLLTVILVLSLSSMNLEPTTIFWDMLGSLLGLLLAYSFYTIYLYFLYQSLKLAASSDVYESIYPRIRKRIMFFCSLALSSLVYLLSFRAHQSKVSRTRYGIQVLYLPASSRRPPLYWSGCNKLINLCLMELTGNAHIKLPVQDMFLVSA